MPVKRLRVKDEIKGKSKPRRQAPQKSKKEYKLPDGPTPSITSIGEVTFLLYGETKIGKTSLASCFEEPVFMMFEPGAKGLDVDRILIDSWEDFIGYIDALIESAKYKTAVVDTVATAYKMCIDYVLDREGVDDPGEVTWGNGWKAIADEFEKQIKKLSNSGRGVVFIAHHEVSEFEKRTGGMYNRVVPRMMKQARAYIEAFVDVTGFYGYFGDRRYLTISGSDEIDAGHRLKKHFRTQSGERIHSIPMFDSKGGVFDEEMAYQRLVRAFQNKQKTIGRPDDEVAFTDVRAKKKKDKRF